MKKLLIFLALFLPLQIFSQSIIDLNPADSLKEIFPLSIVNLNPIIRAYDPNQPLNIEDECKVWLDGKDAGQFTLDGTYVDDWTGKGSLEVHVVNTNDNTTRPTYDINTGRVTFSNANQTFLQSAAFASALSQPNTIFIVYKITGALSDYEYVFDGKDGVSRNVFYFQYSAFKIRANTVLNYGNTNTNDNIHCVLFNGVSSECWINGVSVASGDVGALSFDKITLGAAFDLSLSADISISEVIVYNADISDVDRDKITGYLAWKWKIPSETNFYGYVLRQD